MSATRIDDISMDLNERIYSIQDGITLEGRFRADGRTKDADTIAAGMQSHAVAIQRLAKELKELVEEVYGGEAE